MKHNSPIAREGWLFVAIPGIIAVALWFTPYYEWAIIPMVLCLFCAFFFRNPQRVIQPDKGLVFAPADGKILGINRVHEDLYINDEAIQIRIFLSIFDVHVNRAPIQGKVEWIEKTGGLFLPAYKLEAASKNASNRVGILSEYGRILVVQITGLIARRIVCWVKPGDVLMSGERFGLIRFGSCTELYLPVSAQLEVKAGDKVKGGETVIARFPQ